MNALNKMIDNAMKTCSPSNGEGLAKRIGVTRSAVSKWKSGTPIADDHLIALAKLAHASREEVIEVKIEIAKTAEARAFWRQFGAAAALAVVALFPTQQASAANLNDSPGYALCEMAKRLARLMQRLWSHVTSHDHAPAVLAAR